MIAAISNWTFAPVLIALVVCVAVAAVHRNEQQR